MVSDPGVVVLHEGSAARGAQRGRRRQALERQQQQPGEPTRLQLSLRRDRRAMATRRSQPGDLDAAPQHFAHSVQGLAPQGHRKGRSRYLTARFTTLIPPSL